MFGAEEIRTSTLVMAALLLGSGFLVPDRRWRALVACMAWFFGFEATYQLGYAAAHGQGSMIIFERAYQLLVVEGWIVAARVAGIKVNRYIAGLTVALWAV